MESKVLTGTGSGSDGVSYTNSTGQNVRIVINYMVVTAGGTVMSWTGDNGTAEIRVNTTCTIGKDLGCISQAMEQTDSTSGASKVITTNYGQRVSTTGGEGISADLGGLPTEIALGPDHTFSVSYTPKYSIVIIPEAG